MVQCVAPEQESGEKSLPSGNPSPEIRSRLSLSYPCYSNREVFDIRRGGAPGVDDACE